MYYQLLWIGEKLNNNNLMFRLRDWTIMCSDLATEQHHLWILPLKYLLSLWTAIFFQQNPCSNYHYLWPKLCQWHFHWSNLFSLPPQCWVIFSKLTSPNITPCLALLRVPHWFWKKDKNVNEVYKACMICPVLLSHFSLSSWAATSLSCDYQAFEMQWMQLRNWVLTFI